MDGRAAAYQLVKYILLAHAGRGRQHNTARVGKTGEEKGEQANTQTDAVDLLHKVSSISMSVIIGSDNKFSFFININLCRLITLRFAYLKFCSFYLLCKFSNTEYKLFAECVH